MASDGVQNAVVAARAMSPCSGAGAGWVTCAVQSVRLVAGREVGAAAAAATAAGRPVSGRGRWPCSSHRRRADRGRGCDRVVAIVANTRWRLSSRSDEEDTRRRARAVN